MSLLLLGAAGLSTKADDKAMNTPMVLAILVYLVILVTMVYGRSQQCWSNCSRPASATPR